MSEPNLSQQIREYVVRISESGPAALAGLYDLTAPRLLRFAITITRNQHDAEDAVQAVLVATVARPTAVATACEPWHYLLRMVRNESLMILRKKRRWMLSSILNAGLNDLLAHRDVNSVEQEDMQRTVLIALRSLPVEQSQVVVLKIWEELTFQEIADMLDCSIQTVASRYRYAIQKLMPKLRACHEETVHHGG
ncbi:MAG: RNA polymerase sigma factor [Pirellula sp.]|jgi:RNA polymerase sigma-70 factor (ECF subfamily)